MARRRSSDYDYGYGYFPPSRPRAAEGGIVAESQRGGFGKSWWAKRWIAVLEGFRIGARLGRGRSYARSGQVLDVTVQKGRVTARVQGSRAKPYGVDIQVKPLTRAQWEKVGAALSRQVLFAAKLLAGEMPQDIETAFAEARVSLFPERAGDLATDCSCPDWSNPCKHVAAVYYLLGEEFDRDPFLIFRLRGLEREDLTTLLGGAGGASTGEPATGLAGAEGSGAAAPEPLPAAPETFWGRRPADEDRVGPVSPPAVSAALLRRLGPFPFWRGQARPADTLEDVYRAAALRGLEILAGGCAPEEAAAPPDPKSVRARPVRKRVPR